MTRSSLLARLLVAAGLGAAAVVAATPQASAQTGDLGYSCSWNVNDVEGTGSARGVWDTAIPDGLEVSGYTRFALDPATGTVVLPDAYVAALRDEGITSVDGTAALEVWWDIDGTPWYLQFRFAATPVPATGSMTLQLTGVDNAPRSVNELEVWDLDTGSFSLSSDDDTNGMSCVLTDAPGNSWVIDTVTAVLPPATPTPTATDSTTPPATATTDPGSSPTATAVRPALVQTDAVDAGPSTTLALVGLVLLAGAGLSAGGVLAARRAAARRH